MISRIELLKKVDAVAGRLVASLLPVPPRAAPVADPRNLLVVRPGGIGDAALLVPALTAIKERYPAAFITVLAERRNAVVFDLCPAVNSLLLYDKPGDLLSVLRNRYDVVIDTEQWHRLSAVVSRLVKSSVRIGYSTNERVRLFTHPVPYSHDNYEALSFFHLIEPLGIIAPASIPLPFLTLPDVARKHAEKLLGPRAGKKYLVIFPGASIPERRWGGDRFAALARRLEADGWLILAVGGKQDAEDGELIAGTTGHNLAGQTSLAVTAAIIGGAELLISGDSGLLHLAVGLGVDTVSLFGPGRQKKWGAQGTGNLIINHHLSCSPCTTFGTTPPCPHQVRCMGEIKVDELFQATRRLLVEKYREPRNKILDISR